MHNHYRPMSSRRGIVPAMRMIAAGMIAGSALLISACKGILEATNQDAVTEEQLTGTSVNAALLNGTIQDFANSYEYAVGTVGILSDELTAPPSGPWPNYTRADTQADFNLSQEQASVGQLPAPTWNLFQATRVLAEKLYVAAEAAGPVTSSPLAAQARTYSGMSYLFLGELSCDVAFDLGPAQQPVEAIKLADTHLGEAATIATAAGLTSGTTNYAALAHLMRARAKRDLGQLAAADAEAALVPNGFVWTIKTVLTGAQSWPFFIANSFRSATVAVNFRSTSDPRVPISVKPGAASAGSTAYDQLKYPAGDTPLRLASWQEARLIQAEAALSAGNTATAIGFLNQVRAATAGLAPYPTTATAAQAEQFLQTERGNELFLEARRLIDIQRWGIVPPEYAGTTPFATVCVPVPQSERDNNLNLGNVSTTRSATTFTHP